MGQQGRAGRLHNSDIDPELATMVAIGLGLIITLGGKSEGSRRGILAAASPSPLVSVVAPGVHGGTVGSSTVSILVKENTLHTSIRFGANVPLGVGARVDGDGTVIRQFLNILSR